MKKILVIIVSAVWLLTLFGCASLDKLGLTGGEKEDVAPETPQIDRSFSVASAVPLEGQQALTLYGIEEYAEIVGFIEKSTLDNFISGVLIREKTKTGANPYLVGNTEEDGLSKEKIGLLEDMIINVNPVDWKISNLTPLYDSGVLVEVKYVLPDGRDITGDKFTVKLQAEEWYIDFESFYDSFAKVAQFSQAGRGHVSAQE